MTVFVFAGAAGGDLLVTGLATMRGNVAVGGEVALVAATRTAGAFDFNVTLPIGLVEAGGCTAHSVSNWRTSDLTGSADGPAGTKARYSRNRCKAIGRAAGV